MSNRFKVLLPVYCVGVERRKLLDGDTHYIGISKKGRIGVLNHRVPNWKWDMWADMGGEIPRCYRALAEIRSLLSHDPPDSLAREYAMHYCPPGLHEYVKEAMEKRQARRSLHGETQQVQSQDPLSCHGERHYIALSKKGRIALLNHSDKTQKIPTARWVAWADLGGEVPDCMQIMSIALHLLRTVRDYSDMKAHGASALRRIIEPGIETRLARRRKRDEHYGDKRP